MSLSGKNEQIEHLERWFLREYPEWKKKNASYSRKWLKKVRNKLIRKINKTEIPNIKYKGYEY